MTEIEERIGTIGNYYGELYILKTDGKHYWGIENYDGIRWEKIPEDLFLALLKYETDRAKVED